MKQKPDRSSRPARSRSGRLSNLSLHPLKLEDALRGAMGIPPPPEAKPKKRKAKKKPAKRKRR